MRRLAQRNAWYGVDQGYRKLEALVPKGEVITPKEHLVGAQAAQSLGDITSARVRFVRARDGGLAAEATPILETIDANLLEIKTLSSGFAEAMVTMDEATRSQYLAKMKAEGELAALRWVAARPR